VGCTYIRYIDLVNKLHYVKKISKETPKLAMRKKYVTNIILVTAMVATCHQYLRRNKSNFVIEVLATWFNKAHHHSEGNPSLETGFINPNMISNL